MKKFLLSTITAATLAVGTNAFAQIISVNAGANGFTGWTALNTTNDASQAGRFLGASTTSMDTSGQSWGQYANSGQTSSSVYSFGSILSVGGYAQIDVSLGFIGNGGTVGFALQNSSGDNRFEAYYIGNDATDSFKLNDAGGQENITGPTTSFNASSWKAATPAFQTIRFTLLAGDAYSLSFNGTPVSNTGLTISASDIARIRIFNFNAGSANPDNNQFFNNLSVVPEPSTYALLALSAAGLAGYAARRRARK